MKESLYEQITLTLLLSELSYAFSLIRELARNNQLEEGTNEAALQLPMNGAQLKRILNANSKLKSVMEGQNEDALLQFSAVAEIKERSKLTTSILQSREILGEGILEFKERVEEATDKEEAQRRRRDSTATQGSRLIVFADQSDKGYREQTEMVYGITVNDIEQRVVVAFRGSRTPQDWVQNRKFEGTPIKNPIKGLKEFENASSIPDQVYVHRGFHEYLHNRDGTPEGIFEVLIPILEEYPNYSLWITGHSLGGGLASLFAIEAASREDIPKPVNCITHAQPLVGDIRFFRSVRKLETSGNLNLLRIRNQDDNVTAVPAFSPAPSFCYVHIGWELKLYPDGHRRKKKLSKSESRLKVTLSNWIAMIKLFVFKTDQDKQRRAHSLREYFYRLSKNEERIRGLAEDLSALCSGTPDEAK